MNFVKLKDYKKAEDFLFNEIRSALKEYQKIIWLVPGGSNIKLAAKVFSRLNEKELSQLLLVLTDERYGKPGHYESNDFQLEQAGIDFSKVTHYPVLNYDLSLEDTTKKYAEVLEYVFSQADYIIGQFGIGPDGHTAGILPGSEATTINDKLAIGYKSNEFTRITMTFSAIKRVNKALVFVFGENKLEALKNLKDKVLPLGIEPAQIFKQLKDAYIINDMIGDKL